MRVSLKPFTCGASVMSSSFGPAAVNFDGLTTPILRRGKQEVLTHAFLSDQYANSGNAKFVADAWQRWIDLHRPWNVSDSVEDVTSGSLGCVISLTHQLGVESGMTPPSLFLPTPHLPVSTEGWQRPTAACRSGGTQVKMNAIKKKWMSCNLWRKSQCARIRVAGDGAVAGKQKSLISREARQSAFDRRKKNSKAKWFICKCGDISETRLTCFASFSARQTWGFTHNGNKAVSFHLHNVIAKGNEAVKTAIEL